MESKVVLPGFIITVEHQVVEITTGPRHELDPDWSYTDPAGHVHTSLETLEYVVTGHYYCDTCQDDHDDTEWRCHECGAVVEPVYHLVAGDSAREYAPGLQSVTLTLDDGRSYRLSPDEYPTFNAAGEIEEDGWLERVTARNPDEHVISR